MFKIIAFAKEYEAAENVWGTDETEYHVTIEGLSIGSWSAVGYSYIAAASDLLDDLFHLSRYGREGKDKISDKEYQDANRAIVEVFGRDVCWWLDAE